MKIAVTGTSSGFGKYLLDNWEGTYGVSLRNPLDKVIQLVESADVLINHAYSKDTKQSQLFYEIFKRWEHLPKTIVNFGSSAITENETFAPLYVSNKKHLNNLANSVSSSSKYKKVRVVNFNPSTLENNKIVPEGVSKLEFEDLFTILKFIVDLPQGVEISDLVIKSTQKIKKTAI